jgi:hypothetical protein
MKPLSVAWLAVGSFVALACGQPQTPVPVVGVVADVSQLAGDWTGEYSSVESGRRGSIVFHLSAGADTARGDVLMAPMWTGRPPAEPAPPSGMPATPTTQMLRIEFVRIAGGEVSGLLAPYTDPTCGCTLRTTFIGRLQADTLEGTYTSLHRQTGERQSGRWRVVRERS